MNYLNIEFNLGQKKTTINTNVIINGIPNMTWNNQHVKVHIFSIVDDFTTWLTFHTQDVMRDGKSDFETIIEFRTKNSVSAKLCMEKYAKSIDEVIDFLSMNDMESHMIFKNLFNSLQN